MNNKPEQELDLDLDLSKLFLPAWAQEPPAQERFAEFEPEEEQRKPATGKTKQQRPKPPKAKKRAPQSAEVKSAKPKPAETQAQPAPLPEVDIQFVPEEKCVESIVRQIKITGRAYPLFEIAKLILQRPERHTVTFTSRKTPEGNLLQPLVVCALDNTLWLSEEEAATHILDKHFGLFYQTERVPTEPPKGKYTFVAQCGLSGVILGPPNHHDYQAKLVRLHQERFSNIPFEVFKSHIKIVRDEAVVKKWIEEQSWKTQYICLNVPEPLRLETRQDVEAHFRMVHLPNLIKQVESYTLTGAAARRLKCKGLRRLFHRTYEQQRRFPLQIATALSQRFAAAGLQFFKVNRIVTHVSVARPRYLDLETTPVSESVRRIIQFINQHPKCTRRELVDALAPPPPIPLPIPSENAQQTTGETPKQQPAPEYTPEQLAVIADLHWLIHQGHVIEFADGRLETAKKPAQKPAKQKSKHEPGQPQPAQSSQERQEQLAHSPEPQETELAHGEPAQPESQAEVQTEFGQLEQPAQITGHTTVSLDSLSAAQNQTNLSGQQHELQEETLQQTEPEAKLNSQSAEQNATQPASFTHQQQSLHTQNNALEAEKLPGTPSVTEMVPEKPSQT